MSCVACGKPIGFTNDGAKFCSACGDAVHKQRKCEIPGCKASTEAFYTHCTYHYHRLQREIRAVHSRKPQLQPTRPYRSTAVPVRRQISRSPSPPPSHPTTTTTTVTTAPTHHKRSKSRPPPMPVAAVAPPPPPVKATEVTKPDAQTAPAQRRVLKRPDPPAPQHEPRKRPRQPTNPNVIVEYECGACAARNVVTREVRFLQTFVVRDNVGGAECGAPASVGGETKSTFAAETNEHRRDDDNDSDREVDDILNCKDAGADDCEFQVNITNAVVAATAATK